MHRFCLRCFVRLINNAKAPVLFALLSNKHSYIISRRQIEHMKILSRTLLVVCMATFVTGAIWTAVAFAHANQLSATGFGELRDDGLNLRQTLAFSAIQHPDGTVTGQAEYHIVRDDPNFGENTRFHVEVNCLNINPDGKTATISGVVKNASDPQANGATAIFRVRDNGEGNGNEADGVTPVFLLAPSLNRNCFVVTGIQPTPITAGNVQVRP
jgi:hypothetical protein